MCRLTIVKIDDTTNILASLVFMLIGHVALLIRQIHPVYTPPLILGLFIYSMLESLCKKLNMLYLQLWERSRWCPYLIWFTILLSITGEDMSSNLRAFTAGSVRHFFSLACNVDGNWTHKGKDP